MNMEFIFKKILHGFSDIIFIVNDSLKKRENQKKTMLSKFNKISPKIFVHHDFSNTKKFRSLNYFCEFIKLITDNKKHII